MLTPASFGLTGGCEPKHSGAFIRQRAIGANTHRQPREELLGARRGPPGLGAAGALLSEPELGCAVSRHVGR